MSDPTRPRLLICDLDGTLLGPDRRLSDRSRDAVRAVQGTGAKVALASGRLPRAMAPICQELGLTGPQIALHGGLVASPLGGEVLASVTLSPEEVRSHLAFAGAVGLPIILGYADRFRTTERRADVDALFVPYGEPPPEVVEDLEVLAASAPHRSIIWTGSERYDGVVALARAKLGPGTSLTSGDHVSLELLPAGVDKGRAAAILAATMGLPLENVAAVGDGTNDIELLRVVGRSVAMRHARAEVRAAASVTVPDDVPDDVASAVELLFPGLLPGLPAAARTGS